MSAVEISVIVPTFNRRSSLLRLLESLGRQTLDPGRFEIVVVDNNSTDATRGEVERFASRSAARVLYLSEQNQGAAHARNRGILATSAPIVASTDDDVEAEPSWLEEILGGMAAYSATAVGGRTLPVWECPLPEWWLPEYEKVFHRDHGEEPHEITGPPFFYTHNLAVRRDALIAAGLFDTRLAPTGRRHFVGEDYELCRRILERGGRLYYLPGAAVRHHVPAERLSRSFFRRRFYDRGVSHARQRAVRGDAHHLPYQAKKLVEGTWAWLTAARGRARFRSELEVLYRSGLLVGSAALAGSRARGHVGGD